jgi:hypothetical protein
MIIQVNKLGLAAFIKLKGATLLKYENRYFFFETLKGLSEWDVEYANSCCSKHDSELMNLRRFIPPRG